MVVFDFSGKTFVVTGGSSGIGQCIAEKLMAAKAKVFILDRKKPENSDSAVIACDVSDGDSVKSAFAAIGEQHEELHGIVQCAGITSDSVLWKLHDDQWDEVLDVNLKGIFLVMKHAVPFLRRTSSAAIVNLSSINGIRGKFGQANYAASKAGIIGLSKTAAKELGRFGVRVNVIAPGLVMTPMAQGLPDKIKQAAIDESALGRASDPEDVANAALFLLSDLARQITGEVLKVDGGEYV